MPRILGNYLAIVASLLLGGCFNADSPLYPQDSDDLGIGARRVGMIGTGAEQKPFQVFLVKGVYVMTGPDMDQPILSSFHRIGLAAFLVQSWQPESTKNLYNILDAAGAPGYQLIQLDCDDFDPGVLAEYGFETSLGFCKGADGRRLMDFAKSVVEGRAKPVRDMRRIAMTLEASD